MACICCSTVLRIDYCHSFDEECIGLERLVLRHTPFVSDQQLKMGSCACLLQSCHLLSLLRMCSVQISLTAVAIALAKAHSSNMPQAERLLAINLTGLGTNLIIGWGAWTVVRHRTFRTCALLQMACSKPCRWVSANPADACAMGEWLCHRCGLMPFTHEEASHGDPAVLRETFQVLQLCKGMV